MSSASDPGPDPEDPAEAGDGSTESTAGRGSVGPDDAWLGIVANYGERAQLDHQLDDPLGADTVGGDTQGGDTQGGGAPAVAPTDPDVARLRGLFEPWQPARSADPTPRRVHPDDESDLARGPDAPFVPPVPPAPPQASADRRAAWLGVLGAPLVLLVSLLLGVDLPQIVSLALVAAFVGGFCYLVLTMSRVPRDPGDDGARV